MGRDAMPEEGVTEGAAAYNFVRAGHIGNEQMRAISMVHEQFARKLTHTLGAWLRTQLNIVAAPAEQMPYASFLVRLPDPSYVCLLRLEPLGGVGLLELNLAVAMTMVDLLLGGRGLNAGMRDVTDIEDTIIASVLEVVVRELNATWETAGLRFVLEKHESQSRVERVMPASEQTLCLNLDLEMLGVWGVLNFCLPAVVLNAVHRRLSVAAEKPRKRLTEPSVRMEQLMSEATFVASVRLPAVRIASREIQALKPGMVLELPLPKTTPAELLIGGLRLCAALPVGKGDRRGALLQGDVKGIAARAGVLVNEAQGTESGEMGE